MASTLALAFAAAAVLAGEPVPAEVVRQLADPDAKVRVAGLRALRGRVDLEAAKAAVPMLDDDDPACRDYACWMLLARPADAEARKWIAEKAPRVSSKPGRLAAADALAEWKDPSAAEALAFLAADRDPRVRETALDGIARLPGAAAGPGVARVRAALGDPAPGVRAAAVDALARWKDPDAGPAAERALADADAGVRTAAAAALAAAAPDLFAARHASLAADPDWGVRWTAARHAPGVGPEPPVETLSALLEDPRMRVADEAHDALRAISGLDLPPAKADWLSWWAGAKAKWKPGRRAAAREPERPSVASYHGLPFRSDSVLFVVDLSGSMDQPFGAVDARPRIAVATEELNRTLNALPDRTRADLLVFMTSAERALGKLAELKGGTRDRLRRWFEKQARGRRGDMGGALAAAVLDGEADTVLFLGDGAPSSGDCLYRERILERARQVLRRRPVAVHAVACGSRAADRQFLEQIAALSGGKCVER